MSTASTVESPSRGEMRKVLVVDDNEEVVLLLKKLLQKRGFSVSEAMSAKECLDKISRDCPDLLLLDYMMPEMNGAEVCRIIRDNSHAKDLPIIVVSARAEAQELCLEAGCDAFVRKPFIVSKLFETINAALEKHGRLSEQLPRLML